MDTAVKPRASDATVLNRNAGGDTAKFAPVTPLDPDPTCNPHSSVAAELIKAHDDGVVWVLVTENAYTLWADAATDETSVVDPPPV